MNPRQKPDKEIKTVEDAEECLDVFLRVPKVELARAVQGIATKDLMFVLSHIQTLTHALNEVREGVQEPINIQRMVVAETDAGTSNFEPKYHAAVRKRFSSL